ncbi:MAG: hypothetical protein AAGA84_05775 [Pseudomonadota bacterium]
MPKNQNEKVVADAGTEIDSVSLHQDDACWATLEKCGDSLQLSILPNSNGPWRMSLTELQESLDGARAMLEQQSSDESSD